MLSLKCPKHPAYNGATILEGQLIACRYCDVINRAAESWFLVSGPEVVAEELSLTEKVARGRKI